MPKRTYCYFNEDDVHILLQALSSAGITLYNSNHEQRFTLPSISCDTLIQIDLYNEERGQVWFSPCMFVGDYLQCGIFWLKQEDNTSRKLYSIIKTCVQNCFTYSKDLACYYGEGIYNDWLDKKYCFPILFECDRTELPTDKLRLLFAMLKETQFHIKANDVRLRDMDAIDLNVQSFIVYSHDYQLIRSIVRKSFIHYKYGSTCIFAYKDQKKNVYTLLLDRRLTNDSPELCSLFEKIKLL